MPTEGRLPGPNIDTEGRLPAAVLWDMDGTLVDSEKLWTIALTDTARLLGGELSTPAREAVVGSHESRTLAILFDDLGLVPEPERLAAASHHLGERTAELFAEGLVWRPGGPEALRMVRAAGWPAALVTNTVRRLAEIALDCIGREHFDAVVCGDDVARPKPDPDPYLRAAELLGVAIGQCLVIEDSPAGTLAAERAGAAVLVVPCEVPVPAGPRRVQRPSLEGLSPTDVHEVWARAAGPGQGSARRGVW